jgi:hypothetical protein
MYQHIKKSILFICVGLLFAASCDSGRNTKTFVWRDDIAELTGQHLEDWLRQAPFDNELKKQEQDKVILTNAKQVFPFMGRYYNAVEELHRDYAADDTIIYQQTEILFQDSIWGDLFLSATLLYDDDEVFLNDLYVETGNPFFGGAETVMGTHSASLYETSVVAKKPRYKTGLYWVSANFNRYLLGFYQQGQLVFEAAIPLLGTDTLATLDKLKEINHELGLHIPEWENATVERLQQAHKPKSFWEDPFTGIYLGDYMLNQVYLKTKGTPLTEANTAPKGDHYFSYQSPKGLVELYTVLQKTDRNEADFNKANRKMNSYQYSYQNIFYEEELSAGYVSGTAKTYFKNNQYLEVNYRHPETDSEANGYIHDVLKYIKVHKH